MRNSEDILSIKSNVEKLYRLQGIRLDEVTMADMVNEVVNWKYNTENIIEGLKNMFGEQLREIKLGMIRQYVGNTLISHEETKPSNVEKRCVNCNDMGLTILEMANGYPYTAAFRCNCEFGNLAQNSRSYPWNGQDTMKYNGDVWRIRK